MGLGDYIASGLEYVTGIDLSYIEIADTLNTAANIYGTVQGMQIAEDNRKLQTRELQRQRDQATAKANREARVRKAQLLASQGASGAQLSTTSSGVTGIDSSLAGGLADLNTQVNNQIEQFNLQASSLKAQGVVNLASNLNTFSASSAAGKISDSFTSGIDTGPFDFADTEGGI